MVSEAPQRNKCNKVIGKICKTYYPTLSEPINLIAKALEAHGFNTEPMETFYCGEKGNMNVQVGKSTWLTLQWHKMHTSGRWEINSYVS